MPRHRRAFLADRIANELKEEILGGQWEADDRLPTEASLCARFQVSRATVRSALKELDVLGLIYSIQGSGTYVRRRTTVRDGLERMGSISESIQASGKTARVEFGHRAVRTVTADEATRMEVPPCTEVLELRRRFFADSEVVCYSFDLLPMGIFPADFDSEEITDSLFTYYREKLDRHAKLGVAKVNAVDSTHVAWGDKSEKHHLFLLLDQLQYDQNNELIGYSKTYFVEGAYSFELMRRN